MKENTTFLAKKIVMQMNSTDNSKDNLQHQQLGSNDVALGNKNESVPQQQAIPSETKTDQPLILR